MPNARELIRALRRINPSDQLVKDEAGDLQIIREGQNVGYVDLETLEVTYRSSEPESPELEIPSP